MRDIPLGPEQPHGSRSRFVVLAGAVGLVGLAGYLGYVAYPRFELPAAAGIGLLVLAAAAGIASFFSPCSFPLLLTLLARRVQAGPGRMTAALGFAVPFSAGSTVFLVILGGLITLGGRPLAESVTFTSTAGITIRIVAGALLILLGLVQAEVLPLSFHAVERLIRPLSETQARLRRDRPVAGAVLLGSHTS
ncbi:MAG: cytochrome c biogenesis protein CcdA [Actinomycetota bacterium]